LFWSCCSYRTLSRRKTPPAFLACIKHYNIKTQTGGYVKNLTMPKSVQDTLRDNWDFVQKYDLYKLPVTILKSNNHYYVIQGAIMDETLETIFADNENQ
jgi:hypothetical protein